MEMMNTGVVLAQPSVGGKLVQAVSAVKPVTAAGAEGGFQQALVQQINNESALTGDQTQSSGLASIIAQLEVLASQNGEEAAPAIEDILSLIDGLVDQLEAPSESEGTLDGQLEELQSMLDALNALLALLGVPVPQAPVQLQDQAQTDIKIEGQAEVEAEMTQVKSGLQDSLLQLQAAVQQGALKQVKGQEPFAIIVSQLQTLASALSEDTVSQDVKDVKELKSASASQTPGWLNAQPSASKDAVQLLQRLSQQAVHPSMIKAAVEVTNETSKSVQAIHPMLVAAAEMTNESSLLQQVVNSEALLSGEETVMPDMTLISPDKAKEFAPILTRGAAVQTTFVLAEDFAETMNGLIVQRFDVRTLNGISEARLMLFPEHMGQVDVKISMQNGILTAVFQTDTAVAKDMLDNQMAQLRASLQAQGLNVEKLEVTHSPNASGLTHQHAGQGHQGGQSSGNRQGFSNDEKNVTDNAFEADLVEQAAIQGMGYGRAINETA